jgi:hypothetical protein
VKSVARKGRNEENIAVTGAGTGATQAIRPATRTNNPDAAPE